MEGRVELLGFPDVSALQKTSPEKEGFSLVPLSSQCWIFVMMMIW